MIIKSRLRLVVVSIVAVLLAAVLSAAGASAQAADWPNYRGPQHDGFSQETDWQADWESRQPPIVYYYGQADFAVLLRRPIILRVVGSLRIHW